MSAWMTSSLRAAPSFPSDHASAAFAIAFAVFLFDRIVGSIFLAAAVLIGVGRVFIGAHYPADVLAGCLVGLASTLLVARLAKPGTERVVRLLERITDPVLALVWRSRTAR
jgi:undecaprenyl-diphosphatase